MHLANSLAFALVTVTNAAARVEIETRQNSDAGARVQLSSQSTETGVQVAFDDVSRRVFDTPAGANTLFETLEVRLGRNAPQDLRCQALGMRGQPLVATRGANTDVTFADGGNGPWTFQVPSAVGEIVCDPAFEAASGDAQQVRVILSNSAVEVATQTVFDDVSQRAELPPLGGSEGPFSTIEVSVSQLANPDLRCQVLDERGQPIVATRGANTDVTFSDAEKGPWRFLRLKNVSRIICDPNFRARPQ